MQCILVARALSVLLNSQAAFQCALFCFYAWCFLQGYCRAQRLLVGRVAYLVPVNRVTISRVNSRLKVSMHDECMSCFP
jgi:hypothetical protein